MKDEVRELDIGFVPNADVPEPVLYSSEDTTVLLFYGQPVSGTVARHRVLVELAGCMIASFG